MSPGTIMDSKMYQEIFAEKLQTFIKIQQVSYFLYDGASCHISKDTKKWLADYAIEVIGPWPGSSPDLNLIKIYGIS